MKFNQSQQKIISSIKGAYLISAPVGTGKTTVLTERIITALDSGIKPEEILCLTFTNRAAEEMIQRIKSRINQKSVFDNITIKTFHGFCAYFIKLEAKNIGLSSDFVIFDEHEQIEIMKNILARFPGLIANGENENREILNLVEKLYKYRLNTLEQKIGCQVPEVKIDKDLITVNQEYLQALKEQNALDFNELVVLTLETLYFDQKVRNQWAKKYKFIQLDEFQDTHLSEYLVVKELAKESKNVSFIGDLDQTIYGWRGSEPFLIQGLIKKHFAPVQELSLDINYRFNSSVLAAIKSFLQNMVDPATKNIESNDKTESQKCIEVFRGYNFDEEVSWVVGRIEKIRNSEPKAKIAVLTRANPLISKIAKNFATKNISHITVDKYDFFRRQEIKDVYAYLKIIFNKFDLASAYRLVLRPPRNIGIETLKTIRQDGGSAGLKVSDFLNFKNYNFLEPFDNIINKHSQGRIIVLDTETTGINVIADEIIQIYAIEIINGQPGKDFHFYLKNTIPVGTSYDIHGLDDKFLAKEGRNPKTILKQLKVFINNDIVVGHNVNFDLSMIIENSKRQGIDFVFKEYYDTLDIAKRLIKSRNYKLTTLAELLDLATATHDAKDDVMATAGLLAVLINKLKAGREKRIELFKKFSAKFVKLATLIDSWQTVVKTKRPAEILEYIWRDCGLKDFYDKDEDKQRRFKSIEDLISLFKDKDDLAKPSEIVLRELINYAALVKDINFLGLEKGKIPIVTVHQVKGLEFDYVFIVGVNDYQFPILNSNFNIEEEKRIFYVAMTRAKKKIFISYSSFNDYNRPLTKSQFIDFIDKKYINFL